MKSILLVLCLAFSASAYAKIKPLYLLLDESTQTYYYVTIDAENQASPIALFKGPKGDILSTRMREPTLIRSLKIFPLEDGSTLSIYEDTTPDSARAELKLRSTEKARPLRLLPIDSETLKNLGLKLGGSRIPIITTNLIPPYRATNPIIEPSTNRRDAIYAAFKDAEGNILIIFSGMNPYLLNHHPIFFLPAGGGSAHQIHQADSDFKRSILNLNVPKPEKDALPELLIHKTGDAVETVAFEKDKAEKHFKFRFQGKDSPLFLRLSESDKNALEIKIQREEILLARMPEIRIFPTIYEVEGEEEEYVYHDIRAFNTPLSEPAMDEVYKGKKGEWEKFKVTKDYYLDEPFLHSFLEDAAGRKASLLWASPQGRRPKTKVEDHHLKSAFNTQRLRLIPLSRDVLVAIGVDLRRLDVPKVQALCDYLATIK